MYFHSYPALISIGFYRIVLVVMQEEGYEEIRGEIEMLQQCNHLNVVRYLGSYQGEEYLWVENKIHLCFC